MSETGIHRAAAVGFEAGADAYERGRPSYPQRSVRFLVETLRLGPGATVIDVGAGTGKMTRLLEPSGARIVAVEPVPAMRDRLARAAPTIEVIDGVAEATTLSSAAADAVIVAQAFHWFDGAAALIEFARLLRPSGRLAIVFNRLDDRADLVVGLRSLFERYRGGTPTHRFDEWRAAFDGNDAFGPLRLRSFRYVHRQTAEEVVDRITSISFVAALGREEREGVAARVRALLTAGEPSRGRDIEMPYRTDVFWTQLRR